MFKNSVLIMLVALSGNAMYASLDNQSTPLNVNQQNENIKREAKDGYTVGTCTLINGLALATAYVALSCITKDLEKNKQETMLNNMVGLGLFTTMGCVFAEGLNFLDRMILHTAHEQEKIDLKKSLELNQNK